ncbi:trigger factor [Hoyosella rhizosphaerae]|uniref:Trigger factor n=1 Tax=Hoyosella rhizosphaerae TaxID=1755582 RepID=A0A916UG90_9ACTN|nr:trigger factor [Hoyosella rhizosphaerae]MBN4928107.1 trigger factor [Hoyosella rhizosphaerae]GGC72458.1 trigger factor [Hoyosella rhizosphaerae]
MKSTVEQLSATRVRISVEVPFEELKPDFDRAYKALAQQIRVPGFRQGKVPPRIIDARVGRGAVLEQVINDSVPGRYSEAVSTTDIKAIGQPEIEVTGIEDDHYAFTAEVDVRPEVELPAYDTVEVSVEVAEAADEDVEDQLDELRKRFGTLTPVDRTVENGDFVTLDLSATVDGKPVDDATAEGLSHEVGSGELIEGLDEAIVGVAADETAEFTTKLLAGEFAGEDATVAVTVRSVKVRELPEVDDDFAAMASEFDTVEELRADLREKAEQTKKIQVTNSIRDKVLQTLLDTVDLPAPENVVNQQVAEQLNSALQSLDNDEETLNRLLQAQGKTREEFDKDSREAAEKAVRAQLLLDAIADADEITVGQQELFERIFAEAQRYGMEPQQFIQEIQQQPNGLATIFADARRTKALLEVIRAVNVKDQNGNAIDVTEYFGAPVEDDELPSDESESDEDSTDEAEVAETETDGSSDK